MKIILERNLDFNQFRNVFILNFMCLVFLISIFLNTDNSNVLILLLAGLSFILISLLVLKKGIVVKQDKIFIGYFLFGRLLFKNEVDCRGMHIITLLMFGKTQNYNYSNHWEPKLNYKIASFELFLVNENHTIKEKILNLSKEESSKKGIEFLLKNTGMEFQKYNPSF
jgi:hypothetical protein